MTGKQIETGIQYALPDYSVYSNLVRSILIRRLLRYHFVLP